LEHRNRERRIIREATQHLEGGRGALRPLEHRIEEHVVEALVRLKAEKRFGALVQHLDAARLGPGIVALKPLADQREHRQAAFQSHHRPPSTHGPRGHQGIGPQPQGAIEDRLARLEARGSKQKVISHSSIDALHPKPSHSRREAQDSAAVPKGEALGTEHQKRASMEHWAQRRFAPSLEEWQAPPPRGFFGAQRKLDGTLAAGGHREIHESFNRCAVLAT